MGNLNKKESIGDIAIAVGVGHYDSFCFAVADASINLLSFDNCGDNSENMVEFNNNKIRNKF